jgi:hypothetical protein
MINSPVSLKNMTKDDYLKLTSGQSSADSNPPNSDAPPKATVDISKPLDQMTKEDYQQSVAKKYANKDAVVPHFHPDDNPIASMDRLDAPATQQYKLNPIETAALQANLTAGTSVANIAHSISKILPGVGGGFGSEGPIEGVLKKISDYGDELENKFDKGTSNNPISKLIGKTIGAIGLTAASAAIPGMGILGTYSKTSTAANLARMAASGAVQGAGSDLAVDKDPSVGGVVGSGLLGGTIGAVGPAAIQTGYKLAKGILKGTSETFGPAVKEAFNTLPEKGMPSNPPKPIQDFMDSIGSTEHYENGIGSSKLANTAQAVIDKAVKDRQDFAAPALAEAKQTLIKPEDLAPIMNNPDEAKIMQQVHDKMAENDSYGVAKPNPSPAGAQFRKLDPYSFEYQMELQRGLGESRVELANKSLNKTATTNDNANMKIIGDLQQKHLGILDDVSNARSDGAYQNWRNNYGFSSDEIDALRNSSVGNISNTGPNNLENKAIQMMKMKNPDAFANLSDRFKAQDPDSMGTIARMYLNSELKGKGNFFDVANITANPDVRQRVGEALKGTPQAEQFDYMNKVFDQYQKDNKQTPLRTFLEKMPMIGKYAEPKEEGQIAGAYNQEVTKAMTDGSYTTRLKAMSQDKQNLSSYQRMDDLMHMLTTGVVSTLAGK